MAPYPVPHLQTRRTARCTAGRFCTLHFISTSARHDRYLHCQRKVTQKITKKHPTALLTISTYRWSWNIVFCRRMLFIHSVNQSRLITRKRKKRRSIALLILNIVNSMLSLREKIMKFLMNFNPNSDLFPEPVTRKYVGKGEENK